MELPRRRAVERPGCAEALWLSPIVATPTKALTPSHIKGLCWLDVLYKATARLRPVSYAINRRTYDATLQTVGFWAYLDAVQEYASYEGRSERWIGEQYVDFHRFAQKTPRDVVAAYRRRVENDGWVHPVSLRVLDIWKGYFRALNLFDPGLLRSEPLECSLAQALSILQEHGCSLDLRELNGPVFLDFTAEGVPLRQVVDEHGIENYVVCALRELLPAAHHHVKVLLVCDEELAADYALLERVLARVGVESTRLSLGRVPLDGVVKTSRAGGWEDYTFDRLVESYLPRFGAEIFRIGLRLYFIAALGRNASRSFDFSELERTLQKTERLVARFPPRDAEDEARTLLRNHTTRFGFVDPYRLASLLFANRPDPSVACLLGIFS